MIVLVASITVPLEAVFTVTVFAPATPPDKVIVQSCLKPVVVLSVGVPQIPSWTDITAVSGKFEPTTVYVAGTPSIAVAGEMEVIEAKALVPGVGVGVGVGVPEGVGLGVSVVEVEPSPPPPPLHATSIAVVNSINDAILLDFENFMV